MLRHLLGPQLRFLGFPGQRLAPGSFKESLDVLELELLPRDAEDRHARRLLAHNWRTPSVLLACLAGAIRMQPRARRAD